MSDRDYNIKGAIDVLYVDPTKILEEDRRHIEIANVVDRMLHNKILPELFQNAEETSDFAIEVTRNSLTLNGQEVKNLTHTFVPKSPLEKRQVRQLTKDIRAIMRLVDASFSKLKEQPTNIFASSLELEELFVEEAIPVEADLPSDEVRFHFGDVGEILEAVAEDDEGGIEYRNYLALETELNDKLAAIADLREELVTTKARNRETIASPDDSVQIENLRHEFETTKAQASETITQLQEEITQLKELSQANPSRASELDELDGEFSENELLPHDSLLFSDDEESFFGEIEADQLSELEEAKRRLSDQQEQLSRLQDSLMKEHGKFVATQAALKAAQKVSVPLVPSLDQSKIHDLKDELDATRDHLTGNIERLDSLKRALDNARNEKEELQAKVNNLESQRNDRENQITFLRKQQENHVRTAEELKKREAELAQLERDFAFAKDAVEQLDRRNVELGYALDASQKAKQAWKEEREALLESNRFEKKAISQLFQSLQESEELPLSLRGRLACISCS
ncbi:MAG: hypothetical protein SNF33_02535 [Candidatus Algichlamydia australiensis]|nr:hypothetical protein [Chlamydiales bacterium]